MVLQWRGDSVAGYPSTDGRRKGGDREAIGDREIFEINGKYSITTAVCRPSGARSNEDAEASFPEERFWEN
jgi:hypothetical protein